MEFREWDIQRAKLNHSWLLNQFITFLKSEKDAINAPHQDIHENTAIVEQLLGWNTRKSAIRDLISQSEAALSPRQLLYQHPLDRLPSEVKEWLADVVHAIYLQQSSVPNTVKKLESTFQVLDLLVSQSVASLNGEPVSSLNNNGDALLQYASLLSAQISALPHTIQIHFGV